MFAAVGLAAATIGWWVRGVPRGLLGTVLAIGLGGAIGLVLVPFLLIGWVLGAMGQERHEAADLLGVRWPTWRDRHTRAGALDRAGAVIVDGSC